MTRFCPRCRGIMKPIKENNKTIMVCSRCGFKEEAVSKQGFKISSRIEHSEREKTIILEDSVDISKLPVSREVTCRRCGSHEAYYWVLQTRAADEPPTRFYKCVKCGYVWREYE
ncbi:MAG: transcription factor S [Desulfurococcaceae archaeon]